MNLARRLLLVLAALPLLDLPLRAAETTPETPQAEGPVPEGDEAPSQPASPPATEPAPAPSTPAEEERDPGERLSLDNNLSFPVDI